MNNNELKIKVSRGETINLGNFESLRCDVSIEKICNETEVEKTYKTLKNWAIDKIEDMVNEGENNGQS